MHMFSDHAPEDDYMTREHFERDAVHDQSRVPCYTCACVQSGGAASTKTRKRR
jgi:hypothetical protein